MADEVWYRGSAWSPADREAFEQRLAQARVANRPEYLRIKGIGLLDSGRPTERKAGVELLERVIRDHGADPDQDAPVAGAHFELGRERTQAGDLAAAAGHYRAVLDLERGKNFSHGAEQALLSLLRRDPSLATHLTEADELATMAREPDWEPPTTAASYTAENRLVIEELRTAGFKDADDIVDWTSRPRSSAAQVRRAAPILVRWMNRATDLDVRGACACGLRDRRARKIAAVPVLDAFDALDDPEISKTRFVIGESIHDSIEMIEDVSDEIAALHRFKADVGQALAVLARDEHFDRLEAIVRNADHGDDRVYAFWALDFCKDPRVVDLLIDVVDDPEIGLTALHTLKTVRSERAEPVLQRLASQAPLKKGSPGSRVRGTQISVAAKGLKKLDAARAAGRARP